ncbi:hypothetical protein AN401_11795 [Zobellella denitrificans]|uniref:Uncharacterized protein n=1 Tax=Zobellella denitrificans TaxID=347534 RepID=A0A291HQX0_9GAMM|nr:hypothetical protein AN401_11795 [Zobellella denitrificans]
MHLAGRRLELGGDEGLVALKARLHHFIVERLEEDGLMFEMERSELSPLVHKYVQAYLLEHDNGLDGLVSPAAIFEKMRR